VRPEISLARTTGFRVERPSSEVTDEHVREQIEQLREQRATWAPVEEKPQPGDMVTALLATADETGAMPEGKEYRLVLGSGQAIPGIEELIMDTAPGQSTERPVKWPDDFPDEAQRGQTKLARVTVTEVKRKSLPPLDDALAREVGDFDSLDALRTAVRADMAAHVQREAEAEVRQKLVDEIVSANPFDVPQSWVAQLTSAYAEAYQIPEDDRGAFAQEFRTMAERQVRRDLVIDTIAEREKLAATEADIDDRVADLAQKRGADPSQVYAALQKAGRLREIERSITEDKVFEYLKKQNEVRA
jgi:trigger factor